MKFVLKNPNTLSHVTVVLKYRAVQYVVLGPRGPWSVTFPNMINISSRNKTRRKMKSALIYWLLFFHMTKFRLSWCA